jgi:hypothetical protein
MAGLMNEQQIDSRCQELERYWQDRNKKFQEWYTIIQMIDTLAQSGMESFVGNDPRAAFNLLVSVLNQPTYHALPSSRLTVENLKASSDLANFYDTAWNDVMQTYRQRGRTFDRDLIKFFLATGWGFIYSNFTIDGTAVTAEPLNPATVYPMWDDTLFECSRKLTPGKNALLRMALRNKWGNMASPSDSTVLRDYWYLDDGGKVHNSIIIDGRAVKPDTLESKLNSIPKPRIPIFGAPVGGLPDRGEIAQSNAFFKKEMGQSAIATNENVYATINRWRTFMSQILRDTSQPKTYEKSSRAEKIVKPGEWDKRGAHFKLGLQDEVGYIQPPAMAVEMRSSTMDLEAMEQRGGPSWSMYGDVSSQMTAYVMSQIVSSTNQAACEFHDGICDIKTDIDNWWRELIRDSGFKPYNYKLDKLIENERVEATFEMRIPGDLVQRATAAKMLNPNFTVSPEYIYSHQFQDIRNPMEEDARIRAAEARRSPEFAEITKIAALRQEALNLRAAKDTKSAQLYEKLANTLEQRLTGSMEQQTGNGNIQQPKTRIRPEVSPPNQSEPIAMEGAI